MSSRTNSRRQDRTTDAQQPQDAPNTDAPQQDAPAPDTDAAPAPDAQPEETNPAAPDNTESDETVTESDTPDADAEPTPTPDAEVNTTPTPQPAAAKTPAQFFAEALATATSATTPLDSASAPQGYAGLTKVDAFALAIVIAREETLTALAARKDDEPISTVTLSARPNSASGRGPTLAKVQGTIAMLLGGAGYVSYGNCHASTARNPIHGHVVLPEIAVPFWNALYTAMDAPAGPIRAAEASTRQVNRAGVKAGSAQFKTGYEMDNRLPRVNMLNTIANVAQTVPLTAQVDVMRDLISATTAEFTRVTSIAYIPKGATYVVSPTDAYLVKQELATVGVGVTTAGDPAVATA